MSDLDSRLDDAFDLAGIRPYEPVPKAETLRERLRTYVKQAFIDAGWVNTKKPITGNIHGVGIYEVGEKLFTINGVDELVTHDGTKVKFDPEQPGMLTGQEWYDRFEKETNELKFKPNKLVEAYKEQGLEEQARELAAAQIADAIMGAAKKASGIA